MFVRPRPGLKVRDPYLKDLLPEEGREVPEDPYWHRRLRDKDVELVTPGTSGRNSDRRNAE